MTLEELVPGWALHARWIVWPALAFAATWGTGELDRLWSERLVGAGDRSRPWPERARRATRLRAAPQYGEAGALVLFWWGFLAWRERAPVGALGPALVALLALWLAAVLVGHRVKGTLGLSHGLRAHLRSHAFAACLLGPQLCAALLLIGLRLRDVPLTHPLYALGGLALLAGFAGGGFLLARLAGLVRPAGPATQAAAEAASAVLGVRPRTVLVADLDQVNAFALPSLGSLAVTRRAEAELDADELGAILMHELAHLGEGLRAQLLRLLPALWLLAGILLLDWRTWRIVGLFAAGTLVLALAMRAVARHLERRADRVATHGPAYGRALLRIHQANLVPPRGSRHATHPPLDERLQAAGVVPDFAPAAAPPRTWSVVLSLFLTSCVLGFALMLALIKLGEGPATRAKALASLALHGPNAFDLGQLGTLAWDSDLARATACYRAAAALAPADPTWPYSVAIAEAARGACDAAQRAFEVGDELEWRPDDSALEALRQQAEEAVEGCVPR